jgi:hypothetical protein
MEREEMKPFHVYFHAPCFDGIISTVLLQDFLVRHRSVRSVILHGVNYHLKESWPNLPLEQPCAVLDFLYHPDAQVWFDHHSTTFLSPELKADFHCHVTPERVYDPTASSCALLLWNTLTESFGYEGDRHFPKVLAADRIDSARYESAAEAVLSDSPALRINASLAMEKGEEYSQFLVKELLPRSLEEVAELPQVLAGFRKFQRLSKLGLTRLRRAAHLEEDGIVVFDVDSSDAMVSRYAPFYFFPQGRYSVGVVRHNSHAKLTAMRNPWLDFESVALGEIFTHLGGGGHRRVASTLLSAGTEGAVLPWQEDETPLQRALRLIREADRSMRKEQRHDGAV